jgi:hypothetical protein
VRRGKRVMGDSSTRRRDAEDYAAIFAGYFPTVALRKRQDLLLTGAFLEPAFCPRAGI